MTVRARRLGLGALVLLLALMGPPPAHAAAPARSTCAACHKDWKTVLPAAHPAVLGATLAACLGCHPPSAATKPEPNAFSARLHRAHTGNAAKAGCTLCHDWTPGKRFALAGQKASWGAPSREAMKVLQAVFASSHQSSWLDSLHARKNIDCGGCHDKKVPEAGDTVEEERCFACHGNLDALTARTVSKESPKINPHKSHLVGLACDKCHRAHEASTAYCLTCHKTWSMPIPGSR